MAKPGADETSAKRKKAAEESESESSSDEEAGPQPAAPGQLGEDSDTDGEAGPPKPAPVKQKKKRKLAHEKVMWRGAGRPALGSAAVSCPCGAGLLKKMSHEGERVEIGNAYGRMLAWRRIVRDSASRTENSSTPAE